MCDVDVKPVDIKDLYYKHYNNHHFQERVRESIKAEGMLYPILCFSVTSKKIPVYLWNAFVERNGEEGMDLSQERIHVFAGANRVTSAIELGYTSIDCLVLPADTDMLLAVEGEMANSPVAKQCWAEARSGNRTD
tara:strand:+ start:1781 stop:2185 length:405 start_codon:yes stop_codon:yes gene_type:complete